MANIETATLAGGCFWCTEAIFKRLKGVSKVVSGYTGGNIENPSYDQISMGNTNHAESIQITFDPEVISYEKLLEIFFNTHNPTTLNQQGNDIGTEYRSAIFYENETQKEIAQKVKEEFDKNNHYGKNAVTVIEPLDKFYEAEAYHQDYYERNKDNNPYCTVVIDPKVKKLIKEYSKELKEEYKK